MTANISLLLVGDKGHPCPSPCSIFTGSVSPYSVSYRPFSPLKLYFSDPSFNPSLSALMTLVTSGATPDHFSTCQTMSCTHDIKNVPASMYPFMLVVLSVMHCSVLSRAISVFSGAFLCFVNPA